MKKSNKGKLIFIMLPLMLAFMMTMPSVVLAAQVPVLLGTAENFAVLAGSAITNTGASTISGEVGADVGLSPGSAFTGDGSVTLIGGVFHPADAVAVTAKDDLITAYDDAAGRTPVTRIATELGGQTLLPGVYDSASGTFGITGTLTLDAGGNPDGVFIFLTESTLITASDSNVSLINSARFCRVFWQVGSSATLGTNSNFIGHVLAMTSITANTGAAVQGQLLARNGAVTLDTNNIVNGFCGLSPSPAPGSSATPTPVVNTIVPAPPTPIPTLTPLPTATPTALPTSTPTALPTSTPTALPTATPTALPTATPTIAPIPPQVPSYPTLRVPLIARTVLRNGKLSAQQFNFVLKDSTGKILAEVGNLADGKVVFPDRTFSREVSNYIYTISEESGNDSHIIYDNDIYTVKVTTKAINSQLQATVDIEKNGIPYANEILFTNIRKMPATGDSALMMPLVMSMAALSFVGISLLLKKRSKAK